METRDFQRQVSESLKAAMGSNSIQKQMMEFNRVTVDNAFDAFIALQKHNERIAAGVVEKTPLIPEEGKKVITEWLKSYEKGIEDLKALTDKNYDMMTSFFASAEKTAQRVETKVEEAVKENIEAMTSKKRMHSSQ